MHNLRWRCHAAIMAQAEARLNLFFYLNFFFSRNRSVFFSRNRSDTYLSCMKIGQIMQSDGKSSSPTQVSSTSTRLLFPGDTTTFEDIGALPLEKLVPMMANPVFKNKNGIQKQLLQELITDLKQKFDACIARRSGAGEPFIAFMCGSFGLLLNVTRVVAGQCVKVDIDMVVKKKVGSDAVNYEKTTLITGKLYSLADEVLVDETIRCMINQTRSKNTLQGSASVIDAVVANGSVLNAATFAADFNTRP